MMRLVSLIFFILASSASFARGPLEYQRPIWAMGMGGVYTPFPRDADMPTTNAAYLRNVKSIGLELFNVGIGAPGLETIQDFQDLPPLDTVSDANSYLGKTVWTAFDGRASFVAPNFGVSVYNDFFIRSYFTNPLVPQWYVNYINDYGITVAGAVSLNPDTSIGVAVKRINRWGGENTLGFDVIDQYTSSQDTDVILDQFQDKGVGYGMDFSFLYKSDKSSGPIFTFVWKDVGGTAFIKTAGTEAPPHIAQNMILGAGYVFDGPGIDAKFGVEYREISTIGMQLGEKLHAGCELSLPLIDLRAGMSQGYMTYGLGIDLWLFRMDVAQYTEEMGYYPGQTPEQHLQVAFTLDLSVDADFNIMSQDGKKRKLKQRR